MAEHHPHPEFANELIYFLGLSYEQNLPTWISSSLLFVCALMMCAIASVKQREQAPYTLHWWFLALAFAYISLDEFVEIHEYASNWFDFGGVLFYGWVIPAGIIVFILGILYLRFLRDLPQATRSRFILAGSVYVGGALGVELGLGYWTSVHGNENLGYTLIDWVEESMEIVGIGLFLYALVEYMGGANGTLHISIVKK